MVKFTFQVGDAQQRAGSGALDRPYWVYTVTCRTDSPNFKQQELQVRRRYRDFEYFRNRLSDEFPFCIIPPIPPKEISGTVEKFVPGQHNPALIAFRQRALRKFLSRVGAHHQLQTSALLEQFLELEESDWDRLTKEPRPRQTVEGVLSNIASVAPWSASQAPSGGDAYSAIVSGVELPSNPQVWEETKVYIGQLEQSVTVLRDRLETLVRRRKGTSSALNEFGRNFQQVGSLEQQLDNSGETALSRAALSVGRHSQDLSQIYAEHANQETNTVVEALQYYVGICAAARETLKRLQTVMQTRDNLAAQLDSARANQSKLTSKGASVEKVRSAEAEVSVVEVKLAEARKHVEIFEANFREELKKFHREKQYDMKEILKQFVTLQKDYADKMKRSWDDLIPTVEEVRTA